MIGWLRPMTKCSSDRPTAFAPHCGRRSVDFRPGPSCRPWSPDHDPISCRHALALPPRLSSAIRLFPDAARRSPHILVRGLRTSAGARKWRTVEGERRALRTILRSVREKLTAPSFGGTDGLDPSCIQLCGRLTHKAHSRNFAASCYEGLRASPGVAGRGRSPASARIVIRCAANWSRTPAGGSRAGCIFCDAGVGRPPFAPPFLRAWRLRELFQPGRCRSRPSGAGQPVRAENLFRTAGARPAIKRISGACRDQAHGRHRAANSTAAITIQSRIEPASAHRMPL